MIIIGVESFGFLRHFKWRFSENWKPFFFCRIFFSMLFECKSKKFQVNWLKSTAFVCHMSDYRCHLSLCCNIVLWIIIMCLWKIIQFKHSTNYGLIMAVHWFYSRKTESLQYHWTTSIQYQTTILKAYLARKFRLDLFDQLIHPTRTPFSMWVPDFFFLAQQKKAKIMSFNGELYRKYAWCTHMARGPWKNARPENFQRIAAVRQNNWIQKQNKKKTPRKTICCFDIYDWVQWFFLIFRDVDFFYIFDGGMCLFNLKFPTP